ncbi:hypothetical protein GLOIN_2v1469568 [Rhizophagus irregularis DAOM 181602=DAOM 197198]|uniref:Uncharacterized protein n=1 Tax=Rhizophagus irregularis (strain DAOM 181602 / DAOM 197198 / MUCL 43194) TaxID=747089 RepID=A0A2P4QZK6_RHIID|nr:hypothetical protein GLOIN_2v1469568 [Rhizophagus irregularis DAOM 181602=DAOM 197198]POG83090.1 hypothetical protein GLOIN_2v1469568 [Rhizophagus irregularis DAOM 181602=DAOM 197198]|eukprot:XP_025189956.1 hypothetical protein GLOIN_2v1469568 [Rhizophagus irregularis DAOM 181602=DAOM 197198]
MARFGKNLVFLAYFKDKDQLDAAMALDKGTDDTWIIHGKGLGNQSAEISKRVSSRDLVSTTPRNNGKAMPATKEQAMATSTIIDNVSTDEVVDVVNKYRKNLLDEVPQNITSTSIKDYASPEKVVDIVLDLRAEINKELSQDEKDDEKWIDRCRNGYAVLVTDLKERKKKMEEARVERDTLQKKVDEAQNKEQETKSTKNIKQVLKEAKEAAEQRKCLRKKQGDRVMEEEGIESDSDEDEEDQMVLCGTLRGSWVDRAVGRSARYGEVESVLALVTSM